MKQAYINALADALLSKTEFESALRNTHDLLIKKGHGRLWPAILRGVIKEIEKRNRQSTPQVIVSSEDTKQNEALIKALEAVGATTSDYDSKVDSTIIGGFIVRYRDLMVDASYKRALTDLYRRIIKS
jgi:F0F1-type ATP synthase delta subunit